MSDIQQRGNPIPFPRLLSVEARKLVDTRSGMVMTGSLAVLTLAFVIGRGVFSGPDLSTVIGTAGIGLAIFLPVLGILTITGEWSHRTVLTTFTLEPRRGRVLAAKTLATMIAAVVASVFAILVAVPAVAVVATVQDVPATWEIAPVTLLGWTGINLLMVTTGTALALLLLNAPAAIVVCLSTTILWTLVSQLGSAGQFLAEWFDLNTNSTPLIQESMSAGDLARLTTSMAFWIIVPTVIGFVRGIRREVS